MGTCSGGGKNNKEKRGVGAVRDGRESKEERREKRKEEIRRGERNREKREERRKVCCMHCATFHSIVSCTPLFY